MLRICFVTHFTDPQVFNHLLCLHSSKIIPNDYLLHACAFSRAVIITKTEFMNIYTKNSQDTLVNIRSHHSAHAKAQKFKNNVDIYTVCKS